MLVLLRERLLQIKGKQIVARKARHESTVRAELRINGKEIELNNFVGNFISQTVIGMVSSLRGVRDIETISLKVSKKSK